MTRSALWTLAVAGLVASCAAPPPPSSVPASPTSADALPDDGQTLFEKLERRLAGAGSIHVRCTITSEGTIPSSLRGTLDLRAPDVLRIAFEGTFRGESTRPGVSSDGARMTGGAADKTFDEASPATLRGAVLRGFTRMGPLHNLAALHGGKPPDLEAPGLVDVVARRGAPESVGGRRVTPLLLAMTIRHKPIAEATLWLDAATLLPVKRVQTVHFPNGDMRATDTYEEFTVE